MKTYWISIIFLISLTLVSCASPQTKTGESQKLSPLESQETPTHPPLDTLLLDIPTLTPFADPLSAPPTQGDITPMIPSTFNLEKLITKATEDLAQRLAISSSQISLINATEVMWPNASLGCPQDGMVYADVLTPGYLLILGYNGNTFEYHTGRDSAISTCKDPSPPVQGVPWNT
jgi:hypothetical protein